MADFLKGIRVIDCTLAGAGPSCTKLLTEYGADTIWIEKPGGASTRSVFKFDFYCYGKRSLALDLKSSEGQRIKDKLIREADVFVTNYRPQALKKLRLDYDTLAALNPRLVYGSITAFGDTGADAEKPGYDPVAFWSRGGMLHDFAEKGSLLVTPIAVGDIVSGQALAGGICGALLQRERTGKGCRVTTSLLAQATYINHDAIVESQYGETYPKSRRAPRRALLNTYRCKDGKWITITVTDRFEVHWNKLLEAVGLSSLVGDSRWQKIEDTMYERAPELVDILDGAFAKLTQEEAIRRLDAADIPVSPVQSTTEMMRDPQVWENEFLFKYETADGKQLTLPANPVRFDGEATRKFGPGPRVGQHTREILRSCGCTEADIDALLKKGVISAED